MRRECPGHEVPLVPGGEPGRWAWPDEDPARWGWCGLCGGWWRYGQVRDDGRQEVSFREARSRLWGDAAVTVHPGG